MSSVQSAIVRVGRAAVNFAWNAAASFLAGAEKRAEDLSVDELGARVAAATNQLRGETVGSINTTNALAIGEALLASFQYDERTKRPSCVIPHGVSVEAAVDAVLLYARTYPEKVAQAQCQDGYAWMKPELEANLRILHEFRKNVPEYSSKNEVVARRELVMTDKYDTDFKASDVLEVVLMSTLFACRYGNYGPFKDKVSFGEFQLSGLLTGDLHLQPAKHSYPMFCWKTVPRTRQQIAQEERELKAWTVGKEIAESYRYSTDGVSSFTIPPGVSDDEAIEGINEFCDAWISVDDLNDAKKAYPSLFKKRRCSEPRTVQVRLAVEGSLDKSYESQERVVRFHGGRFPDLRDQMMTLALHHSYVRKGDGLAKSLGLDAKCSEVAFSGAILECLVIQNSTVRLVRASRLSSYAILDSMGRFEKWTQYNQTSSAIVASSHVEHGVP